jgi:hypothetical protein
MEFDGEKQVKISTKDLLALLHAQTYYPFSKQLPTITVTRKLIDNMVN